MDSSPPFRDAARACDPGESGSWTVHAAPTALRAAIHGSPVRAPSHFHFRWHDWVFDTRLRQHGDQQVLEVQVESGFLHFSAENRAGRAAVLERLRQPSLLRPVVKLARGGQIGVHWDVPVPDAPSLPRVIAMTTAAVIMIRPVLRDLEQLVVRRAAQPLPLRPVRR